MPSKNTVGALVSAVAIGAAGTIAAQQLSRPEPQVLNIHTAVLRDGTGVVRTVCAEAQGANGVATTCFTDPLPEDEAKAYRDGEVVRAQAQWKSHVTGK